MKRIVLWILTIILFVTVPIIWWFLMDTKNVNIAIVDKTVANDSYREHQGLVWALNHFKYDDSSEMPYDKTKHYFGAVPQNKNQITERALPTNYSKYDIVYLADTYGVYEDDLASYRANRVGARTEKIYGGLKLEEWNDITKRLTQDKKSVLIAEFNSFASPTEANVRNQALEYIGMDWSGWVGRYFDELDFNKNAEIPQWIVEEHGDQWDYQGGGFVLVNDFTYEFLVLELGKHVGEAGIHLQFTEQGQKYFNLSADPQYGYWFDIVTAQDEEDVLATYDWDLTKNGQELLKEHGIPETFAAVLSTERKNSKNFYFAGDFNDVAQVPIFYQMKGLASVYATLNTFSNDSFYWSAYVPMMKKIINEFDQKPEIMEKPKKSSLGYNARIQGNSFEVLQNGQWKSLTFKGVNLGMGKPGYFPGEAAITEKEYYRWFKYIGEMNANTIRVYTLHPPGFYRALEKYNKQAKQPLYVLHGVWIVEEHLEKTLDAFTPESIEQFKEEMKTIVDVIHGNKTVKPVPGHASGYYDADISDYVIGWVIGIEWYPYMVENTNAVHKNVGQYDGVYVKTNGATPFEHWLAEKMDFLLQYEQNNYGWMRPMSFTNWVTTDLLDHPSEPSEQEDLVGVNPNTIFLKGMAKQTGQFASYHVYPYYPDFLNYDKKYLSYVDHRGKTNSYAGYLADLRAAHTMPVLIAEFGIPGSRGLTHKNPYGWNQGYVSEQQQGEILQSLFEDIIAEDYLGGLIFTWQDEWFKRTWNTMDYDNPDRRPYWSNAQTNEQQFGLLSFDRHKIQVDGDVSEWEAKPLYKGNKDEPYVTVDVDERYVYIQLKGDLLQRTSPQILFDIVPKQGKTSKSDIKDVTFTNGIEFVAELSKKKQSRLWIDPYYDFYSYLYGHKLSLIKNDSIASKKTTNRFIPIDYMLNKPLLLPETNTLLPIETYEAGKLIEGNGNPQAPDYNSLVDYHWSKDGVIELRIPWLLLQAKDPSNREFMGDLYAKDDVSSIEVDHIGIGVLFVNEQGQVVKSLPKMKQSVVGKLQTFTWDKWDLPLSQERLKVSYTIIQQLFEEYE